MTDAEANLFVRKKLKHQRPHLGFGAYSLTLRGDIWLGLDDAEILIPDGSGVWHYVYKMDEETADLAQRAYDIAKKKYEQRKKRRDNIGRFINLNTLGVLVTLSLLCVAGFAIKKETGRQRQVAAREKAIQDEIDAYAATLPNWDDSVRLARNDEELQRALNHREQAQLKIAHFADSLRAVRR